MIGGGQAGLAVAWHLRRRGLRFVVLEAGRPSSGTRGGRGGTRCGCSPPPSTTRLPGMPFPAPADTYPGKDAVADYLRDYATAFDLPVRVEPRVTTLSRIGDGFEVHAGDEVLRARQVVVATGPFQVPFIPPAAARLDTR